MSTECNWSVGMRVQITQDPQMEGLLGTITASEDVEWDGCFYPVPVITLDNGTELRGYQCWWRPAEEDENETAHT